MYYKDSAKAFFSRNNRSLPRLLAAAVLALLILPTTVRAQIDLGSVTGRVHDSSQAVVSSATITATNLATHATRTTTSNRDGLYTLPFDGSRSLRSTGHRTGLRSLNGPHHHRRR
jgi:hypothetical protein